jgi:glycosyltransferase involved in cell wall biosynthesis
VAAYQKGNKGSARPSISACMIVKNEEKLLPRCLDSVKDYVDEIIVVDTGSTDKTVQVALGYGAEVHHHPWENDFSKHRNQSISYAKRDWIFVIDADEMLFQWDEVIYQTLKNKNVDSIYVKVENVYSHGECAAWHNSIRLFRNNRGISYRGRIHNELAGQTRCAYSPIVLHHSGYALDGVKENEKFLRTRGLLEEEIRITPGDPRNHHYLAVSLLGKHLYAEALEEAEIALRLASEEKGAFLYLWTRFVAAVSCINLGRVKEAERLCVEGVKLNPLHLDSYYLLATISYSKGCCRFS